MVALNKEMLIWININNRLKADDWIQFEIKPAGTEYKELMLLTR